MALHLPRMVRLSGAGLSCALFVAVPRLEAVAQRPSGESVARPRIAVIGQTDAGGVRLWRAVTAALRTGPQNGARIIPQRAMEATVAQAYRSAESPLCIADMREFGKLMGAEMVIAISPDTTARASRTRVDILEPTHGTHRVLGAWSPRTAKLRDSIVSAVRADTAFRRLIESGSRHAP
jgi:hypothetical protein